MMLTTKEFDVRNRTDQECWALAKADPCLVTLHQCCTLLNLRGKSAKTAAEWDQEQVVLRELQKLAMVLGRVTYDRFAHRTEADPDAEFKEL